MRKEVKVNKQSLFAEVFNSACHIYWSAKLHDTKVKVVTSVDEKKKFF